MSAAQIELDVRGAVACLTIKRPEKMNSITSEMGKSIGRRCADIDRDPAVKVVLLRGAAERASSAGNDIKALGSYETVWEFRNRIQYSAAVRSLRKPVIAALEGWFSAGGSRLPWQQTSVWRTGRQPSERRKSDTAGSAARERRSFCPG